MPSIFGLYEYSKLATGAYVLLDGGPFDGATVAAKANADDQRRLPEALANQTFNSDSPQGTGRLVWNIPQNAVGSGYFGNDGTGFAATLFERAGAGGGTEKVLAIRGTESSLSSGQLTPDLLLADITQIGFVGFALAQTVSMMNMMLRLRAPLGAPVVQVMADFSFGAPAGRPSVPVFNGAWHLSLVETLPGTGLGMIGANETVVVTGHSLGGHLAAMLGRLFPQNVSEVYAYNAPGFDPEYGGLLLGLGSAALAGGLSRQPLFAGVAGVLAAITLSPMKLTETFVDSLARPWLPGPPASGFNAQVIESEDQAPGDDFSIVSSALTNQRAIGAETFITTEGNSHMIEPLMDNLALQALLASMNTGLTLGEITRLYEAASDKAATTQERIVEALYKLVKGETIALSPVVDVTAGPLGAIGIGAGDIDGRRAYYLRLIELEGAVLANPAIRLESLVDQPPTAEQARSDIAVRYAMRELNPFVLRGVDYARHNGAGELDLYDPATGKGLTDRWLEARAELLVERMAYNRADGGEAMFTRVDDRIANWKAGHVLQTGLVFGADASETLSGGAVQDRIFGGAGGDTIDALAGDDYVEGGEGFDTIDAGLGDDEVHGGLGQDTLRGALGADKLYGGMDGDTIEGGAGEDVIYGDRKDAPDDADIRGDDTLKGDGGDDRIWGGGGNDTIEGGAGDDTIEGNVGEDKLNGDEGADSIKGGAGADRIVGGAGADTLLDGGDDKDFLYGDTEDVASKAGEADTIRGGTGDDEIYAGAGDDTAMGDVGEDLIVGGHGKDTLTGGADDDRLYGGLEAEDDAQDKSPDRLFGEAGNDKLYGGAGNDQLEGGIGDDELRGNAGNDRLIGGAGFDRYVYEAKDGRDIVIDADGQGAIDYDGATLTGGRNASGRADDYVYTDQEQDWRYRFEASGDPDAGRVTLLVTSRRGGMLEVRDFANGELGITLGPGDPKAPGGNPSLGPSGRQTPLPPAVMPGGVPLPTRGDPLVLDLSGAGITTLGLWAKLHFDHDADGFAERTGWASVGAGVLVLDANADGVASTGQELFGDFTRLNGGQWAVNGFQALSAHDSNRDGVIDAADPVWSSLSVGSFDADESTGAALLADPSVGPSSAAAQLGAFSHQSAC